MRKLIDNSTTVVRLGDDIVAVTPGNKRPRWRVNRAELTRVKRLSVGDRVRLVIDRDAIGTISRIVERVVDIDASEPVSVVDDDVYGSFAVMLDSSMPGCRCEVVVDGRAVKALRTLKK
jgi:hypothetical protein